MTRIRTVVATEALLVFGLLVFVGAAFFVERLLGFDEPISLSPAAALLLSAIPALLWLAYFHAQDRHEPEPKHYVVGVYLLGAFIAGPVAAFLAEHALAASMLQPPLAHFGLERFLESVLVIGLAQELSKYVVVRYSIYLSDEFDEPMDGLIYATAAGIGFATYQNYHYFEDAGGSVFIATGAANSVVTTLAHACFAAVSGYVLGRARFAATRNPRHTITLVVGLVIAAGLNGNFQLLESRVTQTGLGVQPWRGVALAAVFAAVVFAVISVLMRRLLALSPHRKEAP